MAGSSVSIPHHEDLIVSRQIQRLAVYFGICQLLSGIVYVICSIIAISQFHDEAIPPVNYGVNFISGLMIKVLLVSSIMNIALCTVVIILSTKAMLYRGYTEITWYSVTLTFSGFISIFFCLATTIASAISVFKQPQLSKRQESCSEIANMVVNRQTQSNKGGKL
ncbi:hypothetical protein TrispH2_009798 [Trichoplax sp. H2]|nr:hypothetical protein TrispH2_009798 [Trichoplax sp. H2]|eukprot:RDD38161.1 hypothetical protein TrispH2_009798 [Trichoplax sp. H2]